MILNKKNIKVRMGIHPYEKFLSIINNKKLIDSLSEIFDKKFNFYIKLAYYRQ